MKRFCAPVRRARRHHLDQRQGRRACSATSSRRRRATRPGRCTSWPAASRARWCRLATLRAAGLRGRRHRRLAVRRVLPGGRRPGRDHRAGAAAATASPSDVGLADWVEERLLPLRGLTAKPRSRRASRSYWHELDAQGRFLLIKLVGGGFRVGVSKLLVQRALAAHAGIDAKRVAQRMMGYTDGKVMPTAERYPGADREARRRGRRRRRTRASPIRSSWRTSWTRRPRCSRRGSGRSTDWLVEWKYDGIRGQVVKRAGKVWLWSRGEELVTERFPEIEALAAGLAGRHRARRRDHGLAGRAGRARRAGRRPRRSRCCSSASAARR